MRYGALMEFSLEALGLVTREHREAKVPKMTQDDLGAQAGYMTGAGVSISRIESGLTRPGSERFEGIALALGLSTSQLESEAVKRTLELAKQLGESPGDTAAAAGGERIKDRVKRIQQEIDRRTALITELGNAFNAAHDRARDDFFMKFVEIADGIKGAPQPDAAGLEDDDAADAQTVSEVPNSIYRPWGCPCACGRSGWCSRGHRRWRGRGLHHIDGCSDLRHGVNWYCDRRADRSCCE